MTDTHWNDRGAFVAYQQIIDAVRKQRPAVPPAHDRSTFNATAESLEGRDLAATIGLKRVLHEEDLRLLPKKPDAATRSEPRRRLCHGGEPWIVTEIPGSTLPTSRDLPRLVHVALAPFLSEHFSRAVYLWQNDFDATTWKRNIPTSSSRKSSDVTSTCSIPRRGSFLILDGSRLRAPASLPGLPALPCPTRP